MTRCRRTDAHRCTLGAHLPRAAEPPLWPALVVLCLAIAAFFASGTVRA